MAVFVTCTMILIKVQAEALPCPYHRRELMTQDEIAVMDGGKCILQLRGVRPFFSDKFDITRHPRYKYLADADKKNTFDIERYMKRRPAIVKPDEPFDLYELNATDLQPDNSTERKELLIDGIISNLTGMFDTLNTKVGEIAGEVGMTPAAWNSSIFNMIRNLSETVIVPIAGIILTFVMCYELIQLIIEKNNLHDFGTWIFFKWIFKTFCAVLIVTNTWNIVMAVFDVAQNVVSQSAGVIISDAGIDISGVVGDLETQLADWSVGALLGLWFQSVFVGLCTQILSICIFLVIYGRMIEVYLVTSIGPIPFATMVNREWGSTGQNYLHSLLALGFQAFLIMICVGIYAMLVEGISTSGDNISAAIWGCMGYTVLLCYILFKTGSLAKSLFGAH